MNEKTEHINIDENDNNFHYNAGNRNLNISFNRISFIFFIFFILAIIFSLKVNVTRPPNLGQNRTNFPPILEPPK